jgi:hypothetical protein
LAWWVSARPIVLKSAKAVISKAPPPVADDARLNTHFLGDRTRAAAFSNVEMVDQFERKDTLSRVEVRQPNGVIIPPQYPVYQNHLGRDFYIVGQEILHLLVEGHVSPNRPSGQLLYVPHSAVAVSTRPMQQYRHLHPCRARA